MNRGLQSKKLAYLEQQLSSNLKATQNRIWTGVTKDVGYLRRMLNELYILKVKVNDSYHPRQLIIQWASTQCLKILILFQNGIAPYLILH